MHTGWITALVFTVLNAGLLRVRIGVENRALAELGPAMIDADVLVAGGGPVGLASALYLQRAGLVGDRGRAAAGPDRQGLRRGADAGRGAGAGSSWGSIAGRL